VRFDVFGEIGVRLLFVRGCELFIDVSQIHARISVHIGTWNTVNKDAVGNAIENHESDVAPPVWLRH
jgi:hypothetical protein